MTDAQSHAFIGGQTRSYWNWNTFFIRRSESYDDRLARGGPTLRRPAGWTAFANINTDSRRRIGLSTNPTFGRNAEGAISYNANLGVTLRPASNILVTLGPSYESSHSTSQFVLSQADPTAADFYGRRYLFSDVVSRTLSMNTRFNVTFTPTLSLELFAQPLISSNDFFDFKEFDAPRALGKSVFGRDRGTITDTLVAGTRGYRIDPDANPATQNSIVFADPDFNVRSLRGNAVLRWEYRPGSTLFLVWTQTRSGSEPIGSFDFTRDREALFDAHPDNIFLVKLSYWLGF